MDSFREAYSGSVGSFNDTGGLMLPCPSWGKAGFGRISRVKISCGVIRREQQQQVEERLQRDLLIAI